jgi:hypothetical protein
MFVPRVLSEERQQAVARLLETDLSDYEISRHTGVGRATVQRWRRRGFPAPTAPDTFHPGRWGADRRRTYAYLLGQYLGDGTITRHGRTLGLHLYLDAQYEEIIKESRLAMSRFSLREPSVYRRPGTACVRLTSYGYVWATAFPQHGAGKKHERKIELVDWQQEIVDEHPRALIRGLIHSDGSRCLNTFSVALKGGPKVYSYPRYFFTNYSADIRKIFCDACDREGIRWSRSNWRNISISHRRSVALLDSFVGPKT